MMATNPTIPVKTQSEERSKTGLAQGETSHAENLVVRLGERLAATANARNVYGEPVTAHDRTVIPVAKVGYGVGAGGGSHAGDQTGGGGGGGVGVRPVGFIEITAEQARFVALSTPRKIIGAVVAGFAAGYLLGRTRL
jgi:uncharacterized spore protein YtfJ